MNYAVVMAGGTGKRLWPLSRKSRPKQVLKILDGQTLLNRCIDRIAPIFDLANILVLTNADYLETIRSHIPKIPPANIIAEPAVRDTTGPVGLSASILSKLDPDASIVTVTADHIIEPASTFQQAVKDALAFINNNPHCIITFGVKPTYPSTKFGYIHCTAPAAYPNCINKIYTVSEFKEKPDEKTACQYLDYASYFWNSGIFVWKAKTILAHLEKFLPQSTEPLAKIKADWATPNQDKTLNEWFPKLPKVSIDYAVMEKAPHVRAIMLDCKWLDVGSYDAIAECSAPDNGNNTVIAADSELLDSKNNIIITESPDHLIAAVGLEDTVIVHTPDATLVCPKRQAHRLKELLERMEKNKNHKFL